MGKNHFNVFTKSFLLALFFLLLQQIIVASSSIWITRLILHISEGKSALVWLLLYLAALLLPYFPGALALIQISKAKTVASVAYIQKFAELFPGKIVAWSNHDQQSTKSSVLSSEAYLTITNYIDYLYHLSASGLNVLINLTTLAFLLDIAFIFSSILGVSFSALVLYFQKNKRKRLALKAQQSRIRWATLLHKAWDNILLNNTYNLNLWKDKAKERGERLIGKAVELEKYSQAISITMAMLLMGPSILLVVYLGFTHLNDHSFLAILTVLLPRLFQVLTYSYELLFLISDYPMQQARLNTVISVLDISTQIEDEKSLISRINWKKISVEDKIFKNEIVLEDLMEKLPKRGRITLQGDNGSGKTSLLLSLKLKYGDEAFFLPAKHELLFKTSKNYASTGQLSHKILNEVKNNIKVPVILLDEWDANLDKKNRESVSILIDKLAENHCVIESIHKRQFSTE